jgi:hypothetical protein
MREQTGEPSTRGKPVEEFKSAAKSPNLKIDIAAQPLPPGGSAKTATLPKRLGNSPHQVDRLRAVFLFGECPFLIVHKSTFPLNSD